MERGCRRPCKNKELVFFLVRKSVNTGGVFATPAALRCVELMDGVYVDVEMYVAQMESEYENSVSCDWKKEVARLGVSN